MAGFTVKEIGCAWDFSFFHGFSELKKIIH